jgi:Fe-S cluster assembly protein SufD
MVSIPPPITQMKTEFERARRWRRGRHEPLQFGDIRWEALDRFLTLGFPTTKDEEWRFTDVPPISEKIFTLALPSANDVKYLSLVPLQLPGDFATELVFVNGYFLAAEPSRAVLPTGMRLGSLSEVLDSNATEVTSYLARVAPFAYRAFVALNTALFVDGACILLPAQTVLEKPIHVRFISTGEADRRPAMSNPRLLVVLGDQSRATVIESYVGPKGVQYFTNAVTEIVLGENAVLDHYKLQSESNEACHTSATNLVTACGANCTRHCVNAGGALVRDEVVAALGGEDAKCTLNGLYIADGERLVDSHTTILHMMQRCRSHQVYNGILAGHARGVFDGKIVIGAEANQSDAKQTNRTLLLSAGARIDSTKHLEQLAKDAHCIQRRIIRRVDEEAGLPSLAYASVRSRGMGDVEARRLVIHAFVRGILKRLPLQPIALGLEELLQQQLESMIVSAV